MCGGFQPGFSIIRISRTPRGPETPSTLPVWSPDKSLTMYSTAGAMPSGPRRHSGILDIARQVCGHAGQRARRQRPDPDVVFAALDRQHVGQAPDAALGGAVIALAEIADQARGRRGIDDDAAAVLAHPAEHRLGDAERALQMHLQHLVPGGFGGLGKGLVEQDAGIVDEDVGAAEMLDGVVEHRLAARHGRDVGAVGDRAAAFRLDRIDDLLRHRDIGAGAVARAAEVVDHHSRALAREQLGVGLTEPAARAGDQRHLAVE